MKAKIALEAIKGQRTIQEIASHYEIHPNLVRHWKKQLLDGAAEIFSNGKMAAGEADEELKAELYQQIGKLQVEVDGLKRSRDFAVKPGKAMRAMRPVRQFLRAFEGIPQIVPKSHKFPYLVLDFLQFLSEEFACTRARRLTFISQAENLLNLVQGKPERPAPV